MKLAHISSIETIETPTDSGGYLLQGEFGVFYDWAVFICPPENLLIHNIITAKLVVYFCHYQRVVL